MKTPDEKAAALLAKSEAMLLKGAKTMYPHEVCDAVIDLFAKQETITRDELVSELERRGTEAKGASGKYKREWCNAAAHLFRTLK